MFTPCGACSRHVRIDETGCPFCGAGREARPIVAPAAPAGNRSFRLGRLAFATAGAALAAVGCLDTGSVEPMYGAPCTPDMNCGYDAGQDARNPADASVGDASDASDGSDAGDAGDAGDPDAGDGGDAGEDADAG